MNASVITSDEAATVESPRDPMKQSGEVVRASLTRVYETLGDELTAVEGDIAEVVRDGLSPGTDAGTHLHEAGGKRIRPLMVLLAARCFGELPRAAHDVAVAAELVHLATLLHDDVIDGGQERRGRPTSRRIWGNAVSVLAGDQLLTQALERTAAAAPPSVLPDLLTTLRRLVNGEIVQLSGRRRLDASEDLYFQVVRDKTASLFAWAARAGAACAGAPPEAVAALGEFGSHAGLAFQLVDDVLDYMGDPQATGKAVLADLAEGKLTLPLIRALSENQSLGPLIEAVRRGDQLAARRVGEAVRVTGAGDSVRALARAETSAALHALKVLPPSPARKMLADIASELALRES
jgi:octaprenyl-diphosphate synthase